MVKEEDREYFPDGICPWVGLKKPESEISRMKDPDRVVINKDKVILIIDYPLTNTAGILLTSKSEEGFTRVELVRAVSNAYHQIYEEEEKTSQVKTIPIQEREGLLNRNQTDGKYGIWGHDLRDLALSSIQVVERNGRYYLLLDIES